MEHKNLAVVSGLLLRGVPQDSSPPIVFLVFLLSHGESLIRNNMAFFCTSCVDMCCSIFFPGWQRHFLAAGTEHAESFLLCTIFLVVQN